MTTYLLTGASSGIGWAMARQLCGAGHTVYGIARRRELLEKLEAEFPQRFFGFAADVTDKTAVQETCRRLPSLPQIAILNAGIGEMDSADRFDLALHERVYAVNYFGALYFIDALFEPMRARRSGKFVAIASLAGYRGLPNGAAYSGSKAALSTAIESMRITYHHTGVEFVGVHPGFIATPMTAINKTKMPFLWSAEEAARYIIAGIESGKLSINFPWPLRLLINVARFLPDGLYRTVMLKQGR